jgi:hypothetical protein
MGLKKKQQKTRNQTKKGQKTIKDSQLIQKSPFNMGSSI